MKNFILKSLILLSIFLSMGSVQSNAQDIVLENNYLYVKLRDFYPSVERYVLKQNSEVIYGDLSNTIWVQVFYQGIFYDADSIVDSITKESDRVCYHLKGDINSQQVVTFDLCYILTDYSVKVVFDNVHETTGYKLIRVRTPDLLTVRATQPGAKLVFPYAEGRLIDIATTNPAYEEVNYGRWDRPLLAGMLYHKGMVGVCSYDNLDMIMYAQVFDHPDEGRLGAIGMYFNYRYFPTNFNSATFINIFDEITTSLSVTLSFVADYNGDSDIDWVDGAKFLQDQVKTSPEKRYLTSFIAKMGRNDVGHITDHLQTIKRLYHLTDHNKIYGYLLECNKLLQFFGVDDDLDSNWGNLTDLKELFQTAEKEYNTFLSFHDNYTDYYPDTPGYDQALRGIQADGTPYQGSYPNYEGMAYHTDPYDYALQSGLNRVRNTLARYPVKESYHLDVFNAYVDQDYSIGSPSNRERNRRGLGLIINEFNKFGINITSEILTGPFVGSGIGWFLHTPRLFETELPFSATEVIPLIEFIYHGKTLYGYGLYDFPPGYSHATFLEPLLLGANSGAHITWTEPGDLELDKFYLIDLPWMALNQRFMQDYFAQGSYRKITYDPDTFVEINYDTNTYTVQVDGRVIGKNYTTYYPKNENTFLIFSRNAKKISFTLPQEWFQNPNSIIKLFKLTEEGIGEGPSFQISNLNIIFNAEANTPYKLRLIILSPPLSPSSLTAKPTSSSSIVLTWKDNSKNETNNETGFNIQRKEGACDSAGTWSLIATKGANVTTHTNTGLTPNTTYSYRVMAYNSEGDSSYSNCASAKTGIYGSPNAPTNLSATSMSASTIKLLWTDNSTDETGFKIYRKKGAEPWGLLTTTAAGAVSYSDASADYNTTTTTYSYYVKACKNSLCSPNTNTTVVPYKPTTLTATAVSASRINLTWTDKSGNETGFQVYRKSGDCSSPNAWSLIATKVSNSTSHSNTGLSSGQTYSYRVRAYYKSPGSPYAYGYSAYSNCRSAATP